MSETINFGIEMKITMTTTREIQRARIYIHIKQKKMRKFFIYKKPEILQKARQFLFHLNIQKS